LSIRETIGRVRRYRAAKEGGLLAWKSMMKMLVELKVGEYAL
jgi:hypothetical protein